MPTIGKDKHFSETFNVMHLNVEGLTVEKTYSLDIILSRYRIDMLCLCEHWLNEDNLKNTCLTNYKLVIFFCRSQFRRGGVCMYAKSSLDISAYMYGNSIEKEFEVCISSMPLNKAKCKLFIVTIYRTPDSSTVNLFERISMLLDTIYTPENFYVICGDFNINLFKDDGLKVNLINVFLEYGLRQHIFTATRITKKSKTLIDNVFSNFTEFNAKVCDNFYSDHTYQVASFRTIFDVVSGPKYVFKRILNDINIGHFADILASEDWNAALNSNDFNVAFRYFHADLSFCQKI